MTAGQAKVSAMDGLLSDFTFTVSRNKSSSFRHAEKKTPAKRILYVDSNPATLIRDEQLLMRAGYQFDTVFGTDGAMACRSVAEYASVLIDEACPLEDRKKLICWLASQSAQLAMARRRDSSGQRDSC